MAGLGLPQFGGCAALKRGVPGAGQLLPAGKRAAVAAKGGLRGVRGAVPVRNTIPICKDISSYAHLELGLEATAKITSLFETLDKNQDGHLCEEDFEDIECETVRNMTHFVQKRGELPKPGMGWVAMKKHFDADGDEFISLEEFKLGFAKLAVCGKSYWHVDMPAYPAHGNLLDFMAELNSRVNHKTVEVIDGYMANNEMLAEIDDAGFETCYRMSEWAAKMISKVFVLLIKGPAANRNMDGGQSLKREYYDAGAGGVGGAWHGLDAAFHLSWADMGFGTQKEVSFRSFLKGVKCGLLKQISMAQVSITSGDVKEAIHHWGTYVNDQLNSVVDRMAKFLCGRDGEAMAVLGEQSVEPSPDCTAYENLQNDRRLHTFYIRRPTIDLLERFWAAYDRNGDGVLSADDFDGTLAEVWTEMEPYFDREPKDGQIEKHELFNGWLRHGLEQEFVATCDADGTLTRSPPNCLDWAYHVNDCFERSMQIEMEKYIKRANDHAAMQ